MRLCRLGGQGDGAFHAVIEVQLLHMRRHDFFDVAPDQLPGAVQHLLFKVAVDRLDAPVGVELKHQHLAVQAAFDLLDGHQVLAQLLDFFLEFAVEHDRSPGAHLECRILLHRLAPGDS